MSRRIIRDVEEALAREVRKLSFHDSRTADFVVFEETFNPFTGEIIKTNIEPSFYDSSADVGNILYPHFFIKLLRSREDRATGRIVPPFGEACVEHVNYSPKGYEIVLSESDGIINILGNTIQTSTFRIRKIQPDFLIRFLSGNNIGTYTVDSISYSSTGPHFIVVSDILVKDLPELLYDSLNNLIVFSNPVDLNTVKVGDVFVDKDGNQFHITGIEKETSTVAISGGTPSFDEGGHIKRTGNIFTQTDISPIRFIIMDPSKPVIRGNKEVGGSFSVKSYSIPIDLYYLIRIDSKTKDNHVDTLNRMWEEFNPPKTGLSTVIRSKESAEQLLTADITLGGSTTVKVADNSKFNLNDKIYIINDLVPSKDSAGEFKPPFEATIVNKIGSDTLILSTPAPDSFTKDLNSRIISNASNKVFMFHLMDHFTRDVESAQYWVHEFTFWVQIWVDRKEAQKIQSAIQNIATPIENTSGDIIIEDF